MYKIFPQINNSDEYRHDCKPQQRVIPVNVSTTYRMFSDGVHMANGKPSSSSSAAPSGPIPSLSLTTRYFSPGLYLENCHIEEVSIAMVRREKESSSLSLMLGNRTLFSTEESGTFDVEHRIMDHTKVVFELVGPNQPSESSITIKVKQF
jgi:hypothetical protein